MDGPASRERWLSTVAFHSSSASFIGCVGAEELCEDTSGDGLEGADDIGIAFGVIGCDGVAVSGLGVDGLWL